MRQPGQHWLSWLGAGIYLALVTLGTYILFPTWVYDDPFITFRYAANLARGQGFVYNLGEHNLSSTTILMVLLLAILYHLSTNLPRWAILISTFSLACGGLALWDLARSWRTPLVGWLALLLYPTFPMLLVTISSEMPLTLALCLAAWAAYVRRRYTLAAALAAFGVLARPDAILVPGLLALHYLWENRGHLRRAFPWRAVLVFCAILLAWVLFAWGYFGSPLPVTLNAKQYQGMMQGARHFIPGLIRQAALFSRYPFWLVEALLALVGVVYALLRQRQWVLFLTWGLVYSLAYTLLGISAYAWYYAPLTPVFLAAAGLGLLAVQELLWSPAAARLTPLLVRYWPDLPARWDAMTHGAPLGAVITIPLLLLLFAGQLRLMGQTHQTPDVRIGVYQAIGQWLQSRTPLDARVGVLEVGAIGYYSQRTMIDFAGLLQPETAPYLKNSSYEEGAVKVVERYRPEYIVVPDRVLPSLEAGPIAKNCQKVKAFPAGFLDAPWSATIYRCHYDS